MNQSNTPEDILKKASDLYDKYDYKNAVEFYELYIATHPEDAEIHYNLGICYEELKNREQAVFHYNKYIELSPDAEDLDEVKRWVLDMNQTDPSKDILKKASDLFDENEYENAAELYEQYLADYPDAAFVHHNLGMCYEELKNREKAVFHYNKYIELSPDAEDIKEVNHRILGMEPEFPKNIIPELKKDRMKKDDNENDMVKIHSVWGAIEAEEILSLLRSCDIPAVAPGAASATVNSFWIDGPSTIHIYVPEEFEKAARKIISTKF